MVGVMTAIANLCFPSFYILNHSQIRQFQGHPNVQTSKSAKRKNTGEVIQFETPFDPNLLSSHHLCASLSPKHAPNISGQK